MKTVSRIIKASNRFFESIARARVQSTLIGMGPEWVERHGYSWVLLRRGVTAWPWRHASAGEMKISGSVHELHPFSDGGRGASGCTIDAAAAHGRARNDLGLEQEKSVA